MWTSRLPAGTQTIVASQSKLDLAELAELADRIHVITGPAQVASTAAVATAPSSSTSGLHAEIAALNRQMQKMALKLERLSRNRSRSRSRSRHRSSSRRSQCWYHQRFGDNAKKCIKPCDYTTSGNARGNL